VSNDGDGSEPDKYKGFREKFNREIEKRAAERDKKKEESK